MKVHNLKPIQTSLLKLAAAAMIVVLGGASLAGAATITGAAYTSVVNTTPPTVDLSTAIGTLDWQIYAVANANSTNFTPYVKKSGGSSITLSAPVVTAPCTTENGARAATAFTWTGGTPTATGTAVNDLDVGLFFTGSGTPAYDANTLTTTFLPGDTLPHTIHLYGYYGGNITGTTLRFTASLSGSANSVLTTNATAGDFDYTVTFQADNASDALTVVLTFQKTSTGIAQRFFGLNAAAINAGVAGSSKLAIWKGPLSSSIWDIGTTANWVTNSIATTYNEGGGAFDSVQFDDTASSYNVVPAAIVSPSSMLVSNSVNDYAIGSGTFGIAGLGGLVKDGSKILILSGANSYAGNTTITGGTLKLATANAIPGGTGKGNVSVTGTLDLNTFSESINGLAGAGTVDTVAGGTPTLTVGGNNQFSTFSGVLKNTSGTLALTKTGPGALTLSGANTYTGNTTISGGTLTVSSASSGGGSYTNADGTTLGVTVAGTSSSLTMSTYGTGANCTNTFAFGSLTGDTAPVINISGNLAMNGDVVVNVTGTTLAGGTTNVLLQYAGTRSGSGSFVLGTIPAGLATNLFLDDTVNKRVLLAVTPNIAYWVGGTDNSPGVITNWSVASNWNPATVPTAGTTIAFGADTFTGTFQPTLDAFHSVGGIIMTNIGQDVIIRGDKPITIGGYGILKTSATDANNLSINTTAGNMSVVTETWLNNSPGLVSVTAGGNFPTGTGTLTLDGTGNFLIGSKITESGALVKKGSGTLTLTNASTFTGGVTLSAGQLNINWGGNNNNSAIGIGPFTISGTSVIDSTAGVDVSVTMAGAQAWNADFTYVGSAANLQLGAGPVTLGGNRQVTVTTNNLTVAGVISGAYSLTKAGNGSLTFGNVSNTYSGDTVITGGALKAGGQNCFPGGVGKGNFIINAGGLLDTKSKNPTINGLSGSGTLDSSGLADGNINLGNNNQTSVFNGNITNSGAGLLSIIKSGSGTLTLNGVNTHRGTTTINVGTLALGTNASIANSAIINVVGTGKFDVSVVSGGFALVSGQTLKGTGTVIGSVTVNAGGTLSPGSTLVTGTLTLSNNLSLAGTTLVKATLDGTGSNDLMVVAGNATYGGTLVLTNTGVTTITNGTVFHLFTVAGTKSGNFSSVTVVPSITNAVAFDPASGNVIIGAVVGLTTVPTTTLLVSSANPSTNGISVTFTATVQTNDVTTAGATSNYVFSVDGTPVATNVVVSGSASYASSALTIGSHTIQAIYLGDGTYLPSTNSLVQVVTNLPPVANPDTATTYWNVPVTLTPLVNDSDPLALPLTLVSVSPSSGTASIINNNTNVLFTPATGASTTATLNYVITNGAGGSASSIITVTVTNPPTPKVTSVKTSGGNLILSGTNGAPNGVYTVLAATNVAQAVATWTPILTNTFDGSGYFTNSIPMTNTVPKDFFRLKQ